MGPAVRVRKEEIQMAKILIVDDDSHFTDVCRLILEREGFEVRTASNRQEGLGAIEEDTPDLIILDVMMEYPDDGFALSRELRSNGFRSPILMLTAISRVTGLDYDKDNELVLVNEFLEKPLGAETLVSKIREWLGN
jgi:DNA-binding response OmpR family regulator